MVSIREAAENFQPKSKETLNIADLDKVSIGVPIESRKFKEGMPDEFEVQVAIVNEKEYRVPIPVLASLKQLLVAVPKMTHFKVLKSGEGKNTQYQTIPLES